MVNEDIITSLKNAIERGESLERAMTIAINTGYNQREVEEAAKFVGGGVIGIEKISQEQMLAMPNQKKIFPNLFAQNKTRTIPTKNENIISNAIQPHVPQKKQLFTPYQADFYARKAPQTQKPTLLSSSAAPSVAKPQQQVRPLPETQSAQQIKQDIRQDISVSEPQRIEPPTPIKFSSRKQNYTKEIILLIILLILIGILIVTFKFRDQIVGFFSG